MKKQTETGSLFGDETTARRRGDIRPSYIDFIPQGLRPDVDDPLKAEVGQTVGIEKLLSYYDTMYTVEDVAYFDLPDRVFRHEGKGIYRRIE